MHDRVAPHRRTHEPPTYELVTFDIFDTLVHRKLRAPKDLFEAVRLKAFEDDRALRNHDLLENFTRTRIEAEQQARERRVADHGGEGEVTLEEVYDQFQRATGCDGDLRAHLCALELALEGHFLFASETGLAAFRALAGDARKVAFISDMYLPSAWLGQTLERLGFAGAADLPIFVSGEHRASKRSGALYERVRAELGVADASGWLHVGDNPHADIAAAQRLGIRTRLADWSRVDNRFEPRPGGHDGHLVDSLHRFLQLPQAAPLTPQGDFEQFGYRVCGPLIFGFVVWLLARCEAQALTRMLFIARDGWLPMALFDRLKGRVGLGAVESVYVHYSRRVGYHLGLREWDTAQTLMYVAGRAPRRLEDGLEAIGLDAGAHLAQADRFGLSPEHGLPPDLWPQAMRFLDSLHGPALAGARDRRALFGAHLAGHLGETGRVGFVDVGWMGNIQRTFLHAMPDPVSPERLVGLYFATHAAAARNVERGLAIEGWLTHLGAPEPMAACLLTGGVEILEFILTADHGSTMGFTLGEDGQVVPVLEAIGPQEAAYRERAMRVQQGIRKYVEDFAFLLDIYRPSSICSTAWAQPFQRLVGAPTLEEARLLGALTHADGVGATSSRLPLAERQPLKVRLRTRKLRRARERAFWKAGFDRLNARGAGAGMGDAAAQRASAWAMAAAMAGRMWRRMRLP